MGVIAMGGMVGMDGNKQLEWSRWQWRERRMVFEKPPGITLQQTPDVFPSENTEK